MIRPTRQFARRIFVFARPGVGPITRGTRHLATEAAAEVEVEAEAAELPR